MTPSASIITPLISTPFSDYSPSSPVPHVISSSHLTFWRLVFLVITPCFFHSFPQRRPPFGTLAYFPPPPLPTPHPPAPFSLFLSPPESFFCLSCSISLSFHHHHPPQQSMKNRCHTTLSVICSFNAKSKITARLCAAVATCILMPPIGVCTSKCFSLTVVINCAKIYHLNKSFYGTALFFFLLPFCLARTVAGWGWVINERRALCVKVFLTVIFFPPCTYLLS